MKPNTPQPLIIKKYENRRLYNTLTSQYINQEQVAQLVREGYDVRVIDAANGEDITRLVLAQIVLDDVKTPDSVFPLDVLRQMIVASGKVTQESALRYMKAMMEMYQNAYRAMPAPLNPFGFFPGGWSQGQAQPDSSQPRVNADHDIKEPPPATTRDADGGPAEVTELRRRVEELEEALAGRKAKAKSQKGKKSKSRRKS
jgi:polyhydroxyalkanoate synthesis repressor PhaR